MDTKLPPAKPISRAVMPVHELIAFHADLLGMKNGELVTKLGYANASIASMLKSGSMKLPIDKVGLAAQALHIDPLYLARCVDHESKFNLGAMLESVANRVPITEHEEKLILSMRKISDGLDIDMTTHPDELASMMNSFTIAARRESAMFNASIVRLQGERRGAAVSGTAKRNYKKPG